MVGNKCVASVYIDTDYMDNYVNATGFQVATWANEGLHGGLEVSHKPHGWNDTMENTINNGNDICQALQYKSVSEAIKYMNKAPAKTDGFMFMILILSIYYGND